ncbi:na(+)-translocating NADH-quinone reductase subunit F [Geobacter sp. OR-1]|uniref:ASKHA domain-containing protein n=1 Tax=Geobacter sp. OR-1 TaxID=1266765 RepID=UPI000541E7D6|nr:ASKHA domain-containing protein [Geobacter sp. OR-1]GAM10795.1 na(+)-translocating NADH-quinone reductase subunit F [Geobacter sp. OR-1]
MAYLRIITDNGEHVVPCPPGMSLREILVNAGFPVRAGCGGIGACGLCIVRIQAGDTDPPAANELRRLRPEQISKGDRLACQVYPCGDLTLTIPSPLLAADWRSLPPDADWQPSRDERHRKAETALGMAIDLGTTRIRLALWDLNTGERLAGRIGPNPQAVFGSDIMNRLNAACESLERAAEIGQLTRNAIGAALIDIAEIEGYRPAKINRVVIVGNSVMLTLLTGRNYDLLLKPAHWTGAIDCQPEETDSWRRLWGISDQASIDVVAPLAGFIGSDLLAAALATRLTEQTAGALLIDFGTNSEIALWDGTTLWATSAAGGPAFEGCGISCGMPAEPGAIHRFEPQSHPAGFRFEVLGGGEPLGICGSGLVDIIANLRRAGILNNIGKFLPDIGDQGLAIIKGRTGLALTKRDIDGFQRAKAAIAAGIRTVMSKAGLTPEKLQRICICGAFGRYLDTGNAREIGMLPQVDPDRVELCGNSALTGCEILLIHPDRSAAMDKMRNIARIINLAQVPEFEEQFISALYLRPMALEP